MANEFAGKNLFLLYSVAPELVVNICTYVHVSPLFLFYYYLAKICENNFKKIVIQRLEMQHI